ncbi:hypothetical protein LCGC14_0129220 [marine sediment metagenome]|uniref:histidine kinase n=1 Tax=marine sediment metagenome TaxID=412755 RepID=A0A0F9V4H8_9ZZZZ|nr:sensor histidine kinase [Maribacter sp.]HDZ06110.1 histidine kinase [Maribacter sp.]HEA80822.1 histidine kinase [Maribacter sp.]
MDFIDFNYVLTSVFTAIFGVFGIYHLASFLVLRHKILFYYFILILGLTLHWGLYLILKGSFGDEVLVIAEKASLTTAMITTYGLLMFTKNYLNIRKSNHPNLSKTYTIFKMIVVCLPIVHVLNALIIGEGWFNNILVMLAAITAMVSIFLNIFSGFRLYNAEKFNRYYLFSYAPLLLAAILYIGTWFMQRNYDINVNPIVLTTSILVTLQLILFSILVGFKFKSIEEENIKTQVEINKMLTKEVDKQTKNLQLAKESLEKQNGELETVNKLKNKLFSLLTHDVRGPLNNITVLVEMIEAHLTDDDLKRITKKLKNEIHDRVSMVNALLEWSYKQLEGIKLNKKICDIEEAFNSIRNEFERMTEEKEVRLIFDISHPKLCIDENMFKVILRNLTSNAIKFSSKGQQVILSSQREFGKIEISVQDFGMGMNTDWYSKLDDDLMPQIREGTNGEKGTGFGLLITKDFVEMNGGEMICESENNKGAKFILRFNPSAEV